MLVGSGFGKKDNKSATMSSACSRACSLLSKVSRGGLFNRSGATPVDPAGALVMEMAELWMRNVATTEVKNLSANCRTNFSRIGSGHGGKERLLGDDEEVGSAESWGV